MWSERGRCGADQGKDRVLVMIMQNQVIPKKAAATTPVELTGPFDALSLVKSLREQGLSGEEEYRTHARHLEELLRTLKHEPLQFEDHFALLLVDEEWTAAEAWLLAKGAAREVSVKAMREALEKEQDDAQGYIDDFVAARAGGDSLAYSEYHDNKRRCQLLRED